MSGRKICGYCADPFDAKQAVRVEFKLERSKVALWFCSPHCCFWAGSKHNRTGSATTIRSLRERFGAGLEVLK